MQNLFTATYGDRAMTTYFRQAKRRGHHAMQPTSPNTYTDENTGRQYVVLHNLLGVLAVYRVRPDGRIKSLIRPPAALKKAFER